MKSVKCKMFCEVPLRDCGLPCSEGCDVCCQLPYNRLTGSLEIHHYFTLRQLNILTTGYSQELQT